MDARDYVEYYFKFMWNKWNENTCYLLFNSLGIAVHIWRKWCNECENNGSLSAPATFWSLLDNECQSVIMDAAVNEYNK